MPESGGMWAAVWGDSEDDPDYVTVARIREFDPPRTLVLSDYRYRAKSGPMPFQADFSTSFTIAPTTTGSTLRVAQAGFPCDTAADEFYAACVRGWTATFAGIRTFLSRK
jgi:uncharacterized protein YndB with AHSA1/START domain